MKNNKDEEYLFVKTIKERTILFDILNKNDDNFTEYSNFNVSNMQTNSNNFINFSNTFKDIEGSCNDEQNMNICTNKKRTIKNIIKTEINEQSLICFTGSMNLDSFFENLICYKLLNYQFLLNKCLCSKMMIDKKIVLLIERLIFHCISSEIDFWVDKNLDLITISCVISFLSFFCNYLSLSKITEKVIQKYKLVKKVPDKNVYESRSQELYEMIKPISQNDFEFFFTFHFNPKYNQITRNIIIENIHTKFDENNLQYTSSFDTSFIIYYYFHKTAFNCNNNRDQESLFQFNDSSYNLNTKFNDVNYGNFKTPKNSQGISYSLQKNQKQKLIEEPSGTPKFKDKDNFSPAKLEDSCKSINMNSISNFDFLNSNFATKSIFKKSNEKSNSFSYEENPIKNLNKSLSEFNYLSSNCDLNLNQSNDSKAEIIDFKDQNNPNKFILNCIKEKSTNGRNFDVFLKKLNSSKDSESTKIISNYSNQKKDNNESKDILGNKRNKDLEPISSTLKQSTNQFNPNSIYETPSSVNKDKKED